MTEILPSLVCHPNTQAIRSKSKHSQEFRRGGGGGQAARIPVTGRGMGPGNQAHRQCNALERKERRVRSGRKPGLRAAVVTVRIHDHLSEKMRRGGGGGIGCGFKWA